MDDQSAAERADGHVDARGLFDASYRRLVVQMYGVCGDLDDAEDAVSEAFVRALAKPREFRRVENPEAWLRTTALNELRGRWRRLRRYATLAHRLPDLDHQAELSPDHGVLVAALQELPEAQRVAIALHHLGDVPVNEIAELLMVPAGTVKARLSRGRAALATLLADGDESTEVRRG